MKKINTLIILLFFSSILSCKSIDNVKNNKNIYLSNEIDIIEDSSLIVNNSNFFSIKNVDFYSIPNEFLFIENNEFKKIIELKNFVKKNVNS